MRYPTRKPNALPPKTKTIQKFPSHDRHSVLVSQSRSQLHYHQKQKQFKSFLTAGMLEKRD